MFDFLNMIKLLISGQYPEFVTKNRLGDRLPVFYYHHIDPVRFEKDLIYLQANGYETIDTDALLSFLSNDQPVPPNKVMLTFDDGYADWYECALPLLKKYQSVAVGFISPFWMDTSGRLTWNQIKEMHATGCFDFQSHSYSHNCILVSPKIVDFYNPRLSGCANQELPILDEDGYPMKEEIAFGTPIYESVSGLSDELMYVEDINLRKACSSFVEESGGLSFFKQKRWKEKLFTFCELYRQKENQNLQFETPETQTQRIQNELLLSKQTIEKELIRKKVHAFAFPRHVQGQRTTQLLCKTGYSLIIGGLIVDDSLAVEYQNVYFIRRVSCDFLRRLPGKGRASLSGVFFDKMINSLSKSVCRKNFG